LLDLASGSNVGLDCAHNSEEVDESLSRLGSLSKVNEDGQQTVAELDSLSLAHGHIVIESLGFLSESLESRTSGSSKDGWLLHGGGNHGWSSSFGDDRGDSRGSAGGRGWEGGSAERVKVLSLLTPVPRAIRVTSPVGVDPLRGVLAALEECPLE